VLKGLVAGGAGVAMGTLLAGRASADAGSPWAGQQASGLDSSHASPAVVELVTATFRDKSNHDVSGTMSHYSQQQLTYTDGTLGLQFQDWSQLKALFDQLMPAWPAAARSYPTRIIGDSASVMVLFTNTPELFGGEVRAISPIDISNGQIVRQVDYWDSRHFGTATAAGLRVPAGQFPGLFGEQKIGERANGTIRRVSNALAAAFSAGNADAATALFAADAVFEDLALHTELIGHKAIAAHLKRALPLVPYGQSASVRHVVGSAQGGGYEWVAPHNPVSRGVVALELDTRARITRLTTTWDGSLLDSAALSSLLATTIEE
jgi:ketosteroid isomerase-like protein